jgi:hypothetical protein
VPVQSWQIERTPDPRVFGAGWLGLLLSTVGCFSASASRYLVCSLSSGRSMLSLVEEAIFLDCVWMVENAESIFVVPSVDIKQQCSMRVYRCPWRASYYTHGSISTRDLIRSSPVCSARTELRRRSTHVLKFLVFRLLGLACRYNGSGLPHRDSPNTVR